MTVKRLLLIVGQIFNNFILSFPFDFMGTCCDQTKKATSESGIVDCGRVVCVIYKIDLFLEMFVFVKEKEACCPVDPLKFSVAPNRELGLEYKISSSCWFTRLTISKIRRHFFDSILLAVPETQTQETNMSKPVSFCKCPICLLHSVLYV